MPEEVEKTKLEKVAARKEEAKKAQGRSLVLKEEYKKLETNPAFIDLLAKVDSFAAYHTKLAKDRTGIENHDEVVGEKVVTVQNIVKLSEGERLAELDRAAGIEEIKDYVARQLT